MIINKFFFPNYIKKVLNPLTNHTIKATNQTSFSQNNKNNILNKNEIKYEK